MKSLLKPFKTFLSMEIILGEKDFAYSYSWTTLSGCRNEVFRTSSYPLYNEMV